MPISKAKMPMPASVGLIGRGTGSAIAGARASRIAATIGKSAMSEAVARARMAPDASKDLGANIGLRLRSSRSR
jgi:hypothetical protein